MKYPSTRNFGHHQVQQHPGCIAPKKRCLVLLVLVALTGAWVINSRLTFYGYLSQNNASEAGDYDLQPPKESTNYIRNSQTVTSSTSQLSMLSNVSVNTSTERTKNETSSLVSTIKSEVTTSSTLHDESAASSTSRATPANLEASRSKSYTIFNVSDFTFLHNNATACQGQSLIVIVHTAIANVKRREVIRNTWGKDYPVFFMLGHGAPPFNNTAIDEESDRYNDIVQGSFIDTYRNLTYKHVMALQWALDYCPNASVIVKVDDDVYVNLELLRKYVDNLELVNKSSVEGNCSSSLMLCDLLINNPVLRNDGSKWKVTKEEYEPNTYPPYCFGWGIIYSRRAASCLLEQVSIVHFLWVDDAYVTGLLAEAAKMKPTQIAREKFGPGAGHFKEKLEFSRLQKFAKNAIIGPTGLGVEEMDYLSRIVSMYKCAAGNET